MMPSTLRSILVTGVIGLALVFPPVADTADRLPTLQGGVEKSDRERQREAYCARYADSYNPFEGSLEVMPKAGQGNRDFCLAPRPDWTLLGEDRNRCCFFAPRDWVPKIPPLPGNVQKDQPAPLDDQTGDLSCRGTYTECFGHKQKLRPKPGPGDPGDVFDSDSPDSDKGQPTPPVKESKDDSDCLPQIDPQVLKRLSAERNEILRALAGGGYIVDLTLRQRGKLIAARLHHLTEPNEGIASRTARAAQAAIEHAPETVVKAGEALAKYLTNDNAANHRYLYGQVEIAVKKAEEELKRKLRNPHVTINEVADALLVGKLVDSAGTRCLQWTSTKIAQYKKKTDQALEASRRIKKTQNSKSISSVCGASQTPRKDCFWQTLTNATGDRSYLLRKDEALRETIYEKLEGHFGGANAKDPMTRRAGDLLEMAEGRPVPVTQDEFVQVLERLPDNAEGMIFISPGTDIGHVVTMAKLRGGHFFWDNQQRTSNMDIAFAAGGDIFWYRYK